MAESAKLSAFDEARMHMVNCQIRTNDVTDHRILEAFASVPRECFVPDALQALAYSDQNLACPHSGGTSHMMAPHILAKLLQLARVRASERVLLQGAGRFYGAAILAQLARNVVAVEQDETLVRQASRILAQTGAKNVTAVTGDPSRAPQDTGPFDVVMFEGRIEFMPEWVENVLAPGGRAVAVIGGPLDAMASLYTRSAHALSGRAAFNAFVPLLDGFAREKTFSF